LPACARRRLFRNPAVLVENDGPWKGLDDLEIATARWVAWFNDERLHSELGDRTPAEIEAEYYAHQSQPDAA
jgi:putative transposase